PEIAARTGLSPSTRVISGIHDSSANFYRYQAAGLTDFTVISTGTWIALGTLRPEIAARTGLSPSTRVISGIHDSSANFYRYQAAG
ncbi:hypothetical protein CNY89_28645, partial [Amaricoccus sp. HAR-UPW-R2A-40]